MPLPVRSQGTRTYSEEECDDQKPSSSGEVVLAGSLSLGMEHPLVLVDVHNLCRSLINQARYVECEVKTRLVL
jgi:hypothetical protein